MTRTLRSDEYVDEHGSIRRYETVYADNDYFPTGMAGGGNIPSHLPKADLSGFLETMLEVVIPAIGKVMLFIGKLLIFTIAGLFYGLYLGGGWVYERMQH